MTSLWLTLPSWSLSAKMVRWCNLFCEIVDLSKVWSRLNTLKDLSQLQQRKQISYLPPLHSQFSLLLLCPWLTSVRIPLSMTTMMLIHQCVVVHIAYYASIGKMCGLLSADKYDVRAAVSCLSTLILRATHHTRSIRWTCTDAPNACEYNLFTSLFGRTMQHWLK